MSVTHQSQYRRDNTRIILEENVYANLLGAINITGLDLGLTSREKMPTGREFGGVIFGKINENGDIVLSETNKKPIYSKDDGRFSYKELDSEIDSNIFGTYAGDEIGLLVEQPKFDCAVFFHTHPYPCNDKATESSRFFSSADINFYKAQSIFFEKAKAMLMANNPSLKITARCLGCVLTMSRTNISSKDDIQFVSFNPSTNEMVYYPNVYIKSRKNGKLFHLKNVHERVFYDANGRLYNDNPMGIYNSMDIERTYLTTDEPIFDDEEKSHRAM